MPQEVTTGMVASGAEANARGSIAAVFRR